MPAGTITLTTNSATVKGVGTAFITELKPGDFVVAVVGGITYTLPVKTVDNATQVTLIRVYDGPTQAGAAWSAVPRETQNSITAQLVAEASRALRGLNYDKDNWQQVFSGTGNVTVKLPDGSAFTGPAWRGFTNQLSEKLSKSNNLGDVDNAATARSNLKLGTAATANIGANKDQVMLNAAWGLGGGWSGYQGFSLNNINDIPGVVGERGLIAFRNNTAINTGGWETPAWGPSLWCRTQDVYAVLNFATTENHLSVSCGQTSIGWIRHKVIWHSLNTVVDGNGYLKKASPVTSIYRDGTCKNNMESEGVTCKRLDVGIYHVDGCLGFYNDNGWKFEVPKDENGSALLWVDYEVKKDGSIIFKTYHRTNDCPISALQNNIDGYANGDSIDIPEGKFLMVRLNVPNSQFAEYVPDDSIPIPESALAD
ncbi:DUF3430 domain-containing protein [Serratia sp. JSRIV002]|uniref:DUF3430 domain-containing protein n=1 Tax=Serratia sp. JSRIV002 TaxID=2831894 RepID=UPI001CBF7C4A|nr:DUF3430 domain-containing protein [Serratia sp. JSRIV002]